MDSLAHDKGTNSARARKFHSSRALSAAFNHSHLIGTLLPEMAEVTYRRRFTTF